MSFILDALRKSEHERQRQAGPVIADMAVARTPSRLPVALLALAALLAVNLAVLLFFLLREDPPVVPGEAPLAAEAAVQAAPQPREEAETPPPSTAGTTAAATTAPTPVTAAPTPPPPVREIRPLAAEASVQAALQPREEAPPPPDPTLLPPAPVTTYPPAAVARQAAAPAARQDDYVPSLDTLPPQATAGLPPLNLDLHIYSPDPAQRTAFISGRRYREGDTMPEGVEVVAITRDGVVLRHRGQRFLLPRQ